MPRLLGRSKWKGARKGVPVEFTGPTHGSHHALQRADESLRHKEKEGDAGKRNCERNTFGQSKA